MAAAAALRATPLDVATFRAYGSGKNGGQEDLSQGFARLCKLLTRALAGLCTTPPNFSLEKAEAIDQGAAAVAEGEGVQAILQQEEPPLRLRVTLDKPLVFALCDLLLGGVGNEQAYAEQRPVSHIERDLGRHLISVIGEVLIQTFDSDALTSLTLWKPKEDAGEDPPDVKPTLRLTLLATIMSYSGEIIIELPSEIAALAKLAAPEADESRSAAKQASGWGEQIAARIQPSEMDVQAVLTSFQMTLEDIGKLLPGQLIRLPTSFAKPVSLESDGVVLHKARLGQQARRFCLSILQPEGRKE